ncbi:hypothetical protein, partial [Symbiopectobacterium sp.]|uniref:hypothetical protein n=1 Tax=Symbiopectobacterium sp. TaxID=2952789 RepID=UPI003F40B03C
LRMVTWGVLMLIGLQKAVINSELQNTVKSRKKKNQVRNDGCIAGKVKSVSVLAFVEDKREIKKIRRLSAGFSCLQT